MSVFHEIFISARATFLAVIAFVSMGYLSPSMAQDNNISRWPFFWKPFETSNPPSTKGYRVLNFAVDITHPPFSYKDATGRVTGFSVELARLICQEQDFTCRFEAVPWEKISIRLLDGRADMAIASFAINKKIREKLTFTHRYFLNPARFIVLKTSGLKKTDPLSLSGKDIAVIEGTAHEAFLRQYYSKADIIPYKDRQKAITDLQREKVDAFFSDGVSLLFWMQSEKAKKCCQFSPGVYTQSSFFGEGIGFSVVKKNARLAKIFNFGLEKLRRSGIVERLYQIHFPAPLY